MSQRAIEHQATARLLGVAPEDIGYLADLPAPQLCAVRRQLAAEIQDANAAALRRITAATVMVPASVSAKAAAKTGKSIFTARMAAVMPTWRAIEIGRRLPLPLLADVAAQLDPVTAHAIVSGLPPDLVYEVATELCLRADWITVAAFAEFDYSAEHTVAMNRAIGPQARLRSLYLVYDPARLRAVVATLRPEDVDELIEVSAKQGLWDELRHCAAAFDPDRMARAAAALATHEPE